MNAFEENIYSMLSLLTALLYSDTIRMARSLQLTEITLLVGRGIYTSNHARNSTST